MLETNKIYNQDCIEGMKLLDDNSVDAIITDPPYGLEFMGKKWDTFTGSDTGIMAKPTSTLADKGFNNLPIFRGMDSVQINAFHKFTFDWAKECLRVLKPGGHLLAFGGSRTYHRLASGVEDAGFEVRDMIEWVYGSGFPKSMNIGFAVDKLMGNERELIGVSIGKGYSSQQEKNKAEGYRPYKNGLPYEHADRTITKGTSEWEGWGTALKPAHEPICMARKPFSEKTVAKNCLKWGTGGINIDGSRIFCGTEHFRGHVNLKVTETDWKNNSGFNKEYEATDSPLGRFPANLIHDNSEEVQNCFPEQKSGVRSSTYTVGDENAEKFNYGIYGKYKAKAFEDIPASAGNASRFFKSIIYSPKACYDERNEGLDDLPIKQTIGGGGTNNTEDDVCGKYGSIKAEAHNFHPTVKPIGLMEYLITMVTKEGSLILDPFIGSGTTAIAAYQNLRKFIGFEIDKEYYNLAQRRVQKVMRKKPLSYFFEVTSNE